ncbi:uncharacterized protein LOC108912569 isoform X2 [Anoplophora glabripennis]|uniref:uncharacterized protein LOC108912569 isoform X2 n=1 Tax=Anoplophora glabripennis TaxID=217634 RepID=UPI000874A3E2|nr:uncharacterized protein LOC108912569 isoform X2 [Anoplophora glabripennis]
MDIKLLLLLFAGALPWLHPSLELLDEVNDAEIYNAVVSSVKDWEKKQELKKISNRTKREDTSVCYPDLGCFEASGPFGYLDMLPGKPEEINTKFMLFPGRSRKRSGSPPAEVPFEKLDDAFEWAKQGFNKSLPTKVLIHGFGSDCSYIWVYEIRSALMAVEEVNIICVDWSNGASLPNYVKASANTRLVGKQLSLLLRGLVEKNGLSLRNTHIIGFSLGAHIAGFAGADLGNLSRITGLDPAGPLFESQDPRARLDQNDAAFVDVIHSNGENLILGGLGSSQPMGHVDFYPNGGRMQKGCSHLFVGAVSDIIWSSAVEGRSLCNHRRAYKFFIDSVSPRCHFPAFPCDSYEDFLAGKCFPCTDERTCGNMGYYADRSKGRGQLYLVTRDEEPFCAHQYNVKIETSPSFIPIKSYGKIQITLIGESFLNETFMMTRKEDEEMRLGDSISRILVPHPILSQPSRVEVLYTAYSGWLSSGLTQWRLDKITLQDSFGKVLSVCKKNLILESGVPVTLPLYPGECNLPKDAFNDEAEDRVHDIEEEIKSTLRNSTDGFTPTEVVKAGLDEEEYKKEKPSLSIKSAMDIFNIPWRSEKENDVIDSEAESSRAFNTRLVAIPNPDKEGEEELIREIVEPILKPHSSKNARSHDPNKDNHEITEPILGPTTAKNRNAVKAGHKDSKSYKGKDDKSYHETKEGSEWVPKDIPVTQNAPTKWKREDESATFTGFEQPKPPNPLETIATTVQFLPQRLGRMFEQAEKYARNTILPLVSTYTPKFISDFIAPQESQRKYVPLSFEETTTKPALPSVNEGRNFMSKNVASPKTVEFTTNEITTPYTHIQKIRKKGEKRNDDLVASITAEYLSSTEKMTTTKKTTTTTTTKATTTTSTTKRPVIKMEISRPTREDSNVKKHKTPDPLDAIISTVQFIPENIGKMFQQAERFTKDTILPFVNNFTPKFISDFFSPMEPSKYIPLERDTTPTALMKLSSSARNLKNKEFDPPPNIKLPFHEGPVPDTNSSSNIQRIAKRNTKRKSA